MRNIHKVNLRNCYALGKKAMEYTRNTRDELWNAIPEIALSTKFNG